MLVFLQEKFSGAVIIDLSAAFDLVDHCILLNKLQCYGVQSDFLQWIKSYLSERYQSVWIDHVLSEFLVCPTGVPQGSILGPLLFLLFFNDLPANIASSVDSYADDTTITACGPSIEEIEVRLNQDCLNISQWMRSNKMKLNPEKTHLLTLGTQRKLASLSRPLQIEMDGVPLKEDNSKTELLLGCMVEGNLKWNRHIDVLHSKLKKRLAGLSSIKYCCKFPSRKMFAEGIFTSVMVYCLPLFGGMQISQMKDLQVLQSPAARIVCHAPTRTKHADLFKRLNWLLVNQLRSYYTVIQVLKSDIIEILSTWLQFWD